MRTLLYQIALVSIVALPAWCAPDAADLDFFEKQVRPILAEHCYECHGPEKQKADLRLDHITTALTGGSRGPALAMGNPEASLLVEAIRYGDVDLQMPPTGKLSEEKIAVLMDWITRGAPWPEEPVPSGTAAEDEFDLASRAESHWVWQPVEEATPPTPSDESWALDPIDDFVLAKLDEAGLSPAPPADERTLLRRVTFDLTGMPPTPAEIGAFLADEEAGAYERAVDRLLASPRFGERWARHWMDLVRYAETYGHEQDYPIRYAWKYRDYLIRAFNADVPYDRLVAEHIAGDLLPDPRIHPKDGYNESIIGTGFWFMHQATHGPVDLAQDEADRIDNQIDVLTKAFQGMTVSCARCHDHKFDAISTADYYSLTGFMRSSRQEFAFLDAHGEIERQAKALQPLRDQGRDALRSAVQRMKLSGAPRIGKYLDAARAVIYGERMPETVFADFESEAFEGWQSEGDAFGEGPIAGALEEDPRVGFGGERLADSRTGGVGPTGTLRSLPFVVTHPYIRMLVGGGAHANKTYVALMVDGEPVRKASGRNSHTLHTVVWDAREWLGREATIQLVDEHKNSWGWIGVDDVVLTDSPYRVPVARTVEEVAAERNVDATVLDQWARQLASERGPEPEHPLYMWRKLAAAEGELAGTIADVRTSLDERREAVVASGENYTPFEDFSDGYEGWFPSGQAFTDGPTQPGDWFAWNGETHAATPGVAHSGLVSAKLQGVLRSPTFTLGHDSIHFRVAGERTKIRLVIGQFQLREYNGLLFYQTLIDVNTGGDFQWHTMTRDLGKFKGRPAYIEIVDEGDGYVAVDEIVFSNEPSIDAPVHPANLAVLDALGEGATLADVQAAYENVAKESIGGWLRGADDGGLFPWFFDEGLVCVGDAKGTLNTFAAKIAEQSQTIPDPVRVLAITEGTPVDAAIMVRGNPKNESEVVPRRFLEALEGDDFAPVNGGSGRMNLVEHIFDPENPLTARVAVNRFWHLLFGRGIVPSVDNFGVLGETPSHPELLDYLATEYREDGWSPKRLIRRLVLSQTYRMASAPEDAEAEAQDPANVLLHRMNIRRLQGEAVRDSILATAGTLNPQMYGQSVGIYLSPFMGFSRRPASSGPMDGDLRRTIYVEVRRNFLSPMMLAFDMPLPDTTIGRRTVSNIPAQALILMNDPFVLEQAQAWADRVAADTERTPEARVRTMFETALGRLPRADEIARVNAFADEQAAIYGLSGGDAWNDARVWRDLCHVMYTLKEFVYIS